MATAHFEGEEFLKDFTIVPNHIIRHESLSIRARLILIWLLSKSNNWEIQLDNLRKEFGMGRDAMREVFSELNEAGYATLQNMGKRDNGKFKGQRWRLIVKATRPDSLALENQAQGIPGAGPVSRSLRKDRFDESIEFTKRKDSSPNASGDGEEISDFVMLDQQPDQDSLSKPSKLSSGKKEENDSAMCINVHKPFREPTEKEVEDFVEEAGLTIVTADMIFTKYGDRNHKVNFWNRSDWRPIAIGLEKTMQTQMIASNLLKT